MKLRETYPAPNSLTVMNHITSLFHCETLSTNADGPYNWMSAITLCDSDCESSDNSLQHNTQGKFGIGVAITCIMQPTICGHFQYIQNQCRAKQNR